MTTTSQSTSETAAAVQELLEIMARLRDPDHGCPWDRQQTFATIVPHTLEEAYEVADTIESDAFDDLPDELGDLLFQVVFYARMAEEQSLFDFKTIVHVLTDKLVRRHPHVFGDEQDRDAATQTLAWEKSKQKERQAAGRSATLAGVSAALPAVNRAQKLQKRAALVGFDWPATEQVFDKIEEEVAELRHEVDGEGGHDRLEAELGDVLFACINLARHVGVDAETALRRCNRKFEQRFAHIESVLKQRGTSVEEADLAEMDALWEDAKLAGGSVER